MRIYVLPSLLVVDESGAKITDGGGRDAGGFCFEYASGDVRGRVKVTGRRIGGGYYSLRAELDESRGNRLE